MKFSKRSLILYIIILVTVLANISNISIAANKNNNPTLKELYIDGQNIIPVFNSSIVEYYLNIEKEISDLQIIAIPDDENANIKITGNDNLKIGINQINILVTAENETDKRNYKILVTKGNLEEANSNLKELTIKNNALVPEFDVAVLEYIAINKIIKDDIVAVTENEKSKIKILETDNLFTITVTAEDEITKKTYKIINQENNEQGNINYDYLINNNIENTIINTNTDQNNDNNKFILQILVFCFIIIVIIVIIRLKLKKGGK